MKRGKSGISTSPIWLQLSSWERPEWLTQAQSLGTADQVCPRCGRAEKFSVYCTLCYYPIQLDDVRIHTPGDTHACVFKRVPPDAKNGGWGDYSVPPWDPEEGIVDHPDRASVRRPEA